LEATKKVVNFVHLTDKILATPMLEGNLV